MKENDRQKSRLSQVLQDREWGYVKMDAIISRENRDKLNTEWCIVCGRAAVEEHSTRFHAAGGCLAGPFCSGRCAWHWLRDDRITNGDYPQDVVREVYRENTDHVEFERYSAAEAMWGVQLFPRGGKARHPERRCFNNDGQTHS